MFKKNIAVTGFTFGLINASDGTAITSGTVSGFVTKDGGTQAALTNSAVHKGNGQWSVNLTLGEMNADIVGLIFTHASAIPVPFTIRTVTKLVSDLVDLTAAQVNAEVDTALNDYDGPTKAEMDAKIDALNDLSPVDVDARLAAIHLDHLFATAYDPASKPGAASALLNEIIEDDGGQSRFTANALEEGPGGGGGGSSLTQQEVRDALKLAPSAGSPAAGSVDAHLDDIPADVDTILTGAHGSGAWGSAASGTGARTVQIFVQDAADSANIQNATVRLSAAGMEDEVGITNGNGIAEFYIDDALWDIVVTAGGGYNSNTGTIDVNGDVGTILLLTGVSLTPPPSPNLCTVAILFKTADGNPIENATVKAELVERNSTIMDTELSLAPVTATTDASGRADVHLIQQSQFTTGGSGQYRITINDHANLKSFAKVVTIPNQATAWLEDLPSV